MYMSVMKVGFGSGPAGDDFGSGSGRKYWIQWDPDRQQRYDCSNKSDIATKAKTLKLVSKPWIETK